ncbi:MAG: hypothetical protein H6571_22130 [Lewinellaceae bacterium]|nr:hypothetical protein [Lewinellaceae bacterium]
MYFWTNLSLLLQAGSILATHPNLPMPSGRLAFLCQACLLRDCDGRQAQTWVLSRGQPSKSTLRIVTQKSIRPKNKYPED